MLATEPGADWLAYVQSGGVVGVFLALTWGLLTKRIVMGWTYTDMVEERNYYRDLAHKGTEIADRQTTVAEAMLERVGVLELRGQVLEAAERERRRKE